jgi:hypothetical protein
MIAVFAVFCLLVIGAGAQELSLEASNVRLETLTDAFGLEQQVVIGQLFNTGTEAIAGINVYVDLYNADDEVIGEAFGYVVNQCGEALLDAPLQPQQTRLFSASVDIFGEGEVTRFEVIPSGEQVEAEAAPDIEIADAVETISNREVVLVEWQDNTTLRYGVGCDWRVFTTYDWYQVSTDSAEQIPLDASPNEAFITDLFLRQTSINLVTQSQTEDPTLFERSFLTFSTQVPRVVYQNDIHTISTAQNDGSFKRLIHSRLSQYSLQGFVWSPIGNFVAYYFGAFGEPVRYFTASANSGLISALLPNNTPSNTVPGLTDDGQRVIISGTFANTDGTETTGYWFSSVATQQRELMFETDELPGNNYPAPAYFRKDNDTRYVYLIRPVDGQATLQCYFREGGELNTLTPLPLQLANGERAWSWLSPDASKLAIAANGIHGGLWLVDLTAFDVCR